MANTTEKLEWRGVVQVVTIARFRRPDAPTKCNVHRYHVWRWKALPSDPNMTPFWGMKCQCGCLTWEPRDKPLPQVQP